MVRRCALILVCACLGCSLPPVDAGETLDSSGSTSSPATTSGVDDDDDDGAATSAMPDPETSSATGIVDDEGTDTGAPICTPNPGFECESPVDCVEFAECGPLGSPFDELGCGRPRCAGGECPDGSVCVTPQDWGDCVGSGTCEQEGATCDCFIQLDCGAEYCVPAAIAPPALCVSITDPTECTAAGCDLVTATATTDGDTCTCEPLDVCVWLGDSTPTDEPTVYFVGNDGPYVRLAQRWAPEPLGLHECSTPECACAECP